MQNLSATTVYLLLAGASSFFFTLVFTVSAVYRVTMVGLDPLQLVLVGTVLESAVFLGEIPTGIVADVYSRRLSVIIGIFLIGVAFIIEGAIPLFVTVLLSQVLWGIGFTFTSGAKEAWIADEIGEGEVSRVYLRGAQWSQIGALLGTFFSVALASIQVNVPIVVGGGLFVGLGLFLLFAMPERGFQPRSTTERNFWQAMHDTLQGAIQMIRLRPVLLTILLIGGIYGMSSEGFDRLWAAHLLENFTLPDLGIFQPIVWFGIINAVAMLLSIGAVEMATRRFDTSSHLAAAWTLSGINLGLLVSVMLFGLTRNFLLALTTYWSTYLLRAINDPMYTAWVNQGLDTRVRATVISASSQANALGQILGGPVLGAIGRGISLSAALVSSGLVLAPVMVLYMFAMRKSKITR